MIEDEYLFGSDLLVAPLFEESSTRRVYLPPGGWIDYQSGRVHEGGRWHALTAGALPIVLLVRSGAVIPLVAVAQSTADIDWGHVELRVFSADGAPPLGTSSCRAVSCRNTDCAAGGSYALERDPLAGRVQWRVSRIGGR
jgi:alpha-D-xyloside xylohydrolase